MQLLLTRSHPNYSDFATGVWGGNTWNFPEPLSNAERLQNSSKNSSVLENTKNCQVMQHGDSKGWSRRRQREKRAMIKTKPNTPLPHLLRPCISSFTFMVCLDFIVAAPLKADTNPLLTKQQTAPHSRGEQQNASWLRAEQDSSSDGFLITVLKKPSCLRTWL